MLERVEKRLRDGAALLQVREPTLTESQRAVFTQQVIGLAHRHGAKVMVKAPCEGADGIHFTAHELETLSRRPEGVLAAASCHTRMELERAMELGLDFAVLGPVKATPTHPEAEPLGWARFAARARGATMPIYAIGGLTRADLEDAWRAGAHGIAMVRGAWT